MKTKNTYAVALVGMAKRTLIEAEDFYHANGVFYFRANDITIAACPAEKVLIITDLTALKTEA